MKKLILFLLIGGFFVITPTFAAEYYIDSTNGNDFNTGTTESTAWQTLTNINAISGGDTVYLKGDFNNGGTFTLLSAISGTAGNETNIENWPGETAGITMQTGASALVIQASYINISGLEITNNGIIVTTAGTYGIEIADNTSYVTISNCTVHDLRGNIFINGTAGGGVSNVTIEGNSIHNGAYGIAGAYTSDLEIIGNVVADNIISGIYLSGGSTIVVANNIVYNTSAGGAGMYAIGSTNFRVVNNTIYDNYYGVYANGVTGYLVKNNIVSNNSQAGISGQACTDIALDYNLFHNNNYVGNIGGGSGPFYNLTDWQAAGYDEHSFEDDPQFFDTSNDDFHIHATSPAIDAGLDLSNYTTIDMDRETRPYNSVYDIGADEQQTPDDPSSITTSNITNSSIDVSWTAPTKTVTSYIVEYDTDSGFSNSSTITGISSTNQTISGLTPNTNYYFRVTGVNTTSYMDYSSDQITLTDNDPVMTAPGDPTNLTANPLVKKIELSWDEPTNGADYYTIEYDIDNSYTNSTSTTSSTNSIELTGLKTTQEYYFKVAACNANDLCSAEVETDTRTKPKQVKYVKVLADTITNHSAKIRWQKQPRVKRYKIKLVYQTNSNKTKKKYITVKDNKLSKRITIKGNKIKIKKKLIKGLKHEKKYTFTVRAIYTKTLMGKYSTPKTFTTK